MRSWSHGHNGYVWVFCFLSMAWYVRWSSSTIQPDLLNYSKKWNCKELQIKIMHLLHCYFLWFKTLVVELLILMILTTQQPHWINIISIFVCYILMRIINLASPNNNDDLAWVIDVEWDKKYTFYQYQIHKEGKLLECEYSIH